ncbi:hypothetical protein [Kaarinaea lacus]
MSLTLTLIILFVLEIVVIAGIAAAIVLLRKNKNTDLLEIYKRRAKDYEEKLENELLELDNIGEKFSKLIEPLKNTTYKHKKNEIELLDKRINFIQSEIDAIVNKEKGDDYWDNLCIRLADLMPSPAVSPEEEVEGMGGVMENLDVPQVYEGEDNDIPVLNQAIRIDKNSPAIAYITLTPLQNEIKRLKRIVGRHFGMLSEMKQAILENQQNPEKQYTLPKALKDLQITHVQLTRSVKALKEENARISKILTTENSVAGGSTSMMEETKQKALDSIRQNQPKRAVPRRRSAEN